MPIGQAYTKWLTQREREALATACDLLIDHPFSDEPSRIAHPYVFGD